MRFIDTYPWQSCQPFSLIVLERFMDEIEQYFICPYCGESISMLLDVSATNQQYIEDCEVCCRPIEIRFTAEDNMVQSFKALRADG